jgi:hypothetical protein
MRSRTFLNVSLGILALALAYHFGAQTAMAQATGNPIAGFSVGASSGFFAVVTSDGTVYANGGFTDTPFRVVGQVFGGPTPTTTQESFGSLKARYRGEREPQGVKPSTGR